MPDLPATPDPIHNCPECSHWLPPGTLACPDCHSIIYTQHLTRIAHAAQSLEQQQKWPEARDTWHTALVSVPQETPQAESIRKRIAQIQARIQSGEDQKSRWTKRLGPLAPAALFLIKMKSWFLLLFKLKFLLSFMAFFGIYWALYGWKFALGFTLSILIHELGHYVAVRRRGLKADLPFFLPGLGAYVRWYHNGIPLSGLAAIALAGPLFGLFAAIACGGLFFWTGQSVFLALAYAGAWINLINLVPVLGLDGAQATYALNRLQRGLILIACIILFSLMQEWVFIFIALGMGWRLFTKDAPLEPHTGTLVNFLLLLFVLGTILYFIPPSAFTGAASHGTFGGRSGF
jgi:Zn-dependent protease